MMPLESGDEMVRQQDAESVASASRGRTVGEGADATDAIEQLLQALPTLPAPALQAIPAPPHGWLPPIASLWLLLLPLTAYLLQQMLAPSLAETMLQATPYSHWQTLLNDAQHSLQTGLQLIQEVIG